MGVDWDVRFCGDPNPAYPQYDKIVMWFKHSGMMKCVAFLCRVI